MLEVTYHQAVQEELTQYAVYYEDQAEGLGERFLNEYEQAVLRYSRLRGQILYLQMQIIEK